jgi:hypothetical protein
MKKNSRTGSVLTMIKLEDVCNFESNFFDIIDWVHTGMRFVVYF